MLLFEFEELIIISSFGLASVIKVSLDCKFSSVVIVIDIVDIVQHNAESYSEYNSGKYKGDNPHNDTDLHHLSGAVSCRMGAYHVPS